MDDAAEDDVAEQFVHATAIAVGDACALIRGGSGAGKSDLALRCLTLGSSSVLPEPAHLVSDDQVLIRRHDGLLVAHPPVPIAGLLEVRGLGLARLPYVLGKMVRLVVDLAAPEDIERLPPEPRHANLLGVEIPLVLIAPFEASAPQKTLLALAAASGKLLF